MKTLITGATGYIGKHLINQLLADRNSEIRITALTHSSDHTWNQHQVQTIKADLSSPLGNILDQSHFDIVIHLAALMADQDHLPYARFVETNVHGTENLIRALKGQTLKQFIHISAVGVYGPTGKVPAKEDQPYGAILSHYERSKVEAEKSCLKLCSSMDIPTTILRLGLMYGEDMAYGWPAIIDLIKEEKMKIIGKGSALIHLSHINDIVSGILKTIGNEKAIDQIINICGPDALSLEQVFYKIADLLNKKHPPHVPYLPVYICAKILNLIPQSLKPSRLKTLSPHRVRFFKEDHIYDIKRAENLLDFRPAIDLSTGLANLVKSREEK